MKLNTYSRYMMIDLMDTTRNSDLHRYVNILKHHPANAKSFAQFIKRNIDDKTDFDRDGAESVALSLVY